MTIPRDKDIGIPWLEEDAEILSDDWTITFGRGSKPPSKKPSGDTPNPEPPEPPKED
ncbi:MAG: hypothetical protein GWN97_19595 [Thermoplasmata archaeon]|nr:hypothetical protein [Thermoplasmata archaeon]